MTPRTKTVKRLIEIELSPANEPIDEPLHGLVHGLLPGESVSVWRAAHRRARRDVELAGGSERRRRIAARPLRGRGAHPATAWCINQCPRRKVRVVRHAARSGGGESRGMARNGDVSATEPGLSPQLAALGRRVRRTIIVRRRYTRRRLESP